MWWHLVRRCLELGEDVTPVYASLRTAEAHRVLVRWGLRAGQGAHLAWEEGICDTEVVPAGTTSKIASVDLAVTCWLCR